MSAQRALLAVLGCAALVVAAAQGVTGVSELGLYAAPFLVVVGLLLSGRFIGEEVILARRAPAAVPRPRPLPRRSGTGLRSAVRVLCRAAGRRCRSFRSTRCWSAARAWSAVRRAGSAPSADGALIGIRTRSRDEGGPVCGPLSASPAWPCCSSARPRRWLTRATRTIAR